MATARGPATRRRREILEAALACFAERGVERTTMAEIRARSGASTGSIYHQFPSKDAIAGALYVEALREYQAGLVSRLGRARDAEGGIRAVVRHHLTWVRAHRALAGFLFAARTSRAAAAVDAEIHALNVEFFRAVSSWLDEHSAAGAIRKMPLELYVLVVLGPSQEFARQWLAGRARVDIVAAERHLADAAWRSVRE